MLLHQEVNTENAARDRHATIAATLYLFRTFPTLSTVTYDTPKGPLIANSLADGYVEAGLSISARPTSLDSSEAVEHQKLVAAACGVPFSAIIDFQTAQSNDISKSNLLVVLDPNIYLQALKVDPNELGKLPYRGFYLTQRFSKPHPKYSFKSRVFFPSVGIPEDQVCGSAHTLLAPYWAGEKSSHRHRPSLTKPYSPERQNISTHFSEPLLGLQVSQQGGEVGCRWESWQPGAVAFLIGTGRSELCTFSMLYQLTVFPL